MFVRLEDMASACFYLPLGQGQDNVVRLHAASPKGQRKGAGMDYVWMPGAELTEDENLAAWEALEEALRPLKEVKDA